MRALERGVRKALEIKPHDRGETLRGGSQKEPARLDKKECRNLVGFELATLCSGGKRSNPVSYGGFHGQAYHNRASACPIIMGLCQLRIKAIAPFG